MALIKNKIFIGRIILSGLCLMFLATNFHTENRSSGWYQQFFPNLNGCVISSMTFLDSLTGFAVTNVNSSYQGYILKTTNGGDNWNIKFNYNPPYNNVGFIKVHFINKDTGYAYTNYIELFKTMDGGENWFTIFTNLYPDDIAVINNDTIVAVKGNGFNGGVYRTTNGGINWQLIWGGGGSGMPSNIYMFDKNLGFHWGDAMRRTTNGGFNWTDIIGEGYATVKFVDTLIGWKSSDSIKKTTNGGLSWFAQRTPNISHSFASNSSFSILNKDTLWMVGARYFSHAPIYKTTNGGINWGYQIPDTSFQIYSYSFISFVKRKTGWAYPVQTNYEIHTKIGGNDTTFFTGMKLVENFIPSGYTLGQNYPNPFNPSTNIPFELNESGYIVLKVYDITGRTIKELVNGRWGKGRYIVDYDGTSLPSGIYFYRIEITGQLTKEKFIDSKKMMLLK